MSYNTRLIISAAAVLALTATACHREELRPTPAPASSLVLTAGLPEFETQLTKSQPVTADSLFAYPFWSSMTGPSEAVPNNSFADGRYYFMIPSEADRIFFSNISEYLEDINVTTGPEPEILIEYVSDTGSCFGHDLIYGHITEYDAAAAEQSIQMQRAVARITPRLCHVIGEDTVATSLNFYYDSVSLTLGGIYQGVRIDTASLNASYYGSDSFSLPFDVTETACTMDGFYTLPSAEGTPTVSLDLLMDGSQDIVRISAPLPEPILANHDYNMTFYLHRDNMDGGITLDVQMNELVMDVSDTESFDIIEFSSSSLVFEVDAGSSAELTVYSKTGYWSATIPAEVLSYYTVVNTTAGDTATIENPTLNGNSGDVLAFKTLSNISDHETATIFDIPFIAGAAESYDMTVIQSNGQLEQIEISAAYSNVSLREAYGIFDIYRTDGSEQELVTSVSGQISDLNLSSGDTYLLSGYYIESLEAVSASAVRLLNTPSLSSLHIEYYQASEGLDLSGADRLRSLYLSGNEHITEIDLSGHTLLTDIYCSLSGLERLLLSGCTALTSVEYNTYYTSLRYVDVSGCTSLKTLTEDFSLFLRDLDSLDISRSGIEEISIESSKEQLTYFKLDHCASLKTFYMLAGAYADSLDFTGCTALDSLYIDSNSALTSLTLDGCALLRTVTLQDMQSFNDISLDGAAVENLYMEGTPAMTMLNLDGADIKNLTVRSSTTNYTDNALEIMSMNNSTVESLTLEDNPELITLSLNGCTNLKVLDIEDSDQLNLMYMDGTEAITELKIWSNSTSQLPAPDLSKLTELETLLYNNLTTVRRLDLRANTQLRFFNFANLTNFQYLNCAGLSHLEEVHMNNGGSPDTLIMNGCSSLEKLEYGLNCSKRLKHFESDGMTSLKYLHLTRLRLQELNLDMPALEMLAIDEVSNVPESVLKKIHVSEGNQLKRAYIKGTYYLEISNIELNAQNTLTALEIGSIYYGTAPESTFDLSGYTALDTLKIGTGSGLHHLNLSGCTSLTLADLDYSPLLTLDITGCDALLQLDLGYTDLIGDELNAVFEQLPARELADGAKFRIAGSPGVGFCNLDIASQKHWALVTDDIDGNLEFNF